MNLQFEQLIRKAEGRYLTDSEGRRLEGYAEGLVRRLDVADAVERAEPDILDSVVAAFGAEYPSIQQAHGPQALERVRRDQMLTLRYAAMSMILKDPDFIHDKLSVWNRAIMKALCDFEQVIFGHRTMIGACRSHLTEADADELIPYLEVNLEEFERSRDAA